jgi:hypothetical protein
MAIGAATTCLLGVLMAVLRQEPDYYRERMPAGDGGAARARRFITEVAGLQAAIARPGRWDAAFEEREINAWLATDLPANHARLLPTGVAEPRVRFVPGRIDLAVRVGPRLASAVLHLAVQVHLRGESQLAFVLDEARLGLLPLPRDAVLAEVGRRLGRLGGVTSLRRLDGRSVLVVYIPATHGGDGMGRWLGSLAVVEGSLLVAGETRAGAAPR